MPLKLEFRILYQGDVKLHWMPRYHPEVTAEPGLFKHSFCFSWTKLNFWVQWI